MPRHSGVGAATGGAAVADRPRDSFRKRCRGIGQGERGASESVMSRCCFIACSISEGRLNTNVLAWFYIWRNDTAYGRRLRHIALPSASATCRPTRPCCLGTPAQPALQHRQQLLPRVTKSPAPLGAGRPTIRSKRLRFRLKWVLSCIVTARSKLRGSCILLLSICASR